ncbi:MAG TPA: enoyl-CoA hydratase [Virgibacillus sp.]|nr:enoyl-CoA hydratase [Virgibacillus sp.]
MKTLAYDTKNQMGIITIKSPPANALSSTILEELDKQLDKIEEENKMKVLIIKGEGKFFSAGADIKEFTSFQNASDYQTLAEKGQQIFDRIEQYSIPIIASIHGAALGGGLELAMACHIRIVTESAKLGLPETTLGIIPGFAGTQRLPHYVGSAKAYEMMLTGTPISGEEAYTAGLANKAVADDNLDEETHKLASLIAAKSKGSINAIMKLVPYAKTEQFAKGVHEEAVAFGEIFGTEDAREGVQAFMEKRKPNFKD